MSDVNIIQDNTAAVAEDLRFLLLGSIGRQMVAEFWFGDCPPVRRCGVLTAVGRDYLLLRDETNRQDIAGALCALRLVTICDAAEVAQEPLAEANDAAQAESGTQPTEPIQEQLPSVVHVIAKPRTQAALRYAKRLAGRIE